MSFLRPRVSGTTIEVIEEEAPVHTAQNPYCGKLDCPECRTNVENHGEWTGAPTCDGQVNTSLLDGEVTRQASTGSEVHTDS